MRNDVTGPADFLNGTFERVGTSAFQFTGFTNFHIPAGSLFDGLSVGMDTSTLGLFDYSLVLPPVLRTPADTSGTLATSR